MAYGMVLGQTPITTEVKFVEDSIPVKNLALQKININKIVDFEYLHCDNFSSDSEMTFYWTDGADSGNKQINLHYINITQLSDGVFDIGEEKTVLVKNVPYSNYYSNDYYLRNNKLYCCVSSGGYIPDFEVWSGDLNGNTLSLQKQASIQGNKREKFTTYVTYRGIVFVQDGQNISQKIKYFDFASSSIKQFPSLPDSNIDIKNFYVMSDKNGILLMLHIGTAEPFVYYIKNNGTYESIIPSGDNFPEFVKVDKTNYFPDNKIKIPMYHDINNKDIADIFVYDSVTGNKKFVNFNNGMFISSYIFGKGYLLSDHAFYPSKDQYTKYYIGYLDEIKNEIVLIDEYFRDSPIANHDPVSLVTPLSRDRSNKGFSFYYSPTQKLFNNLLINSNPMFETKSGINVSKDDTLNKVIVDSHFVDGSPSYNWYIALSQSNPT